MRGIRIIILGLAALVLSGAGCPGTNTKSGETALKGFSSEQELLQYFRDRAKASMRSQTNTWSFAPVPGLPSGGFDRTDDMDLVAGAPGAEADTGNETPDWSSTNIQEAGVDESDVVKNDGTHLYVLDGDVIHVVQALPATTPTEVASVELQGTGDSLYLQGTTLVTLSREYVRAEMSQELRDFLNNSEEVQAFIARAEALEQRFSIPEAISLYQDVIAFIQAHPELNELTESIWHDGNNTIVKVLDVATPASPIVKAEYVFEGNLATSRMIDGHLHLVMTSTPNLPYMLDPVLLDLVSLEQWLPDYTVSDGTSVVREGNIVSWQNFSRPVEPDGYSITTIVTIDTSQPTAEFKSAGVTAEAGVIYASTEALYVTDPEYSSFNYDGTRLNTGIHKFALTDAGPVYKGSGSVEGRPLNQYSLGEHNDYLRIATTHESWGIAGTDSRNAVYVLGESEGKLQTVGTIADIAPGERIYSARFMGDRGFLVTFKRIDPLFTMDLSDPTNPRIVGELKVPGYSDHIQMMDENHLLTIGKDVKDDGQWAWMQGVQLSIFDISDMSNPQLKHKELIGTRGTDSEANHNPKAFTYFASQDLLAFPITLYEQSDEPDRWSYGTYAFSGLLVYRVTAEDGFTSLGRISNAGMDAVQGCYWGIYSGYTRGIFIYDHVYAAMPNGVKVAQIDAVDTLVGEVEFDQTNAPWSDCGYWDEPVVFLPEGDPTLR